MSDSNQKDPLEEFFQKKSGDYDISYREEDWKSLEGRLNALDARLAARSMRRWAAAAIFLIISLLSYFIFQNYREINSLNEQLSRQDQQQTIINPLPDSLTENSTNENNTSKPDIADIDDFQNEDNTTGNSQREQITDAGTQPGDEIELDTQINQSLPESDIDAGQLAIADLSCESCEVSQTADFLSPELDTKRVIETNAVYNLPELLNDEEHTQDRKGFGKFNKALSNVTLGIVLGPDMSTAGNFSNFYNPGSKIGITIDYSISSRWALSFGAIRSKVNYKAGSSDYSPPEGYWYNDIEADLTRAICVLIDIPINVSYRFLLHERSRLYASAGVSSYIMLNEDYRFSYTTEQPGLPQRWKEDTGTSHLMSTANLSVGYEYDLSNSVSLRAEPFFRLPIREIGWGNVNLYSMGSLFSINYNLNGL